MNPSFFFFEGILVFFGAKQSCRRSPDRKATAAYPAPSLPVHVSIRTVQILHVVEQVVAYARTHRPSPRPRTGLHLTIDSSSSSSSTSPSLFRSKSHARIATSTRLSNHSALRSVPINRDTGAMSMLDAFFGKGGGGGAFRGAKCKTLLKLSIPRIKLLRNRRELQLRQMRRDIAKLLEAGQEATARIRVEHIIREENMMAAQEILELFCELVSVRLPIIEAQKECPIDLKEAISSICFAAPRCSDLPELIQVQMMFATKYGKEFVAAASELMPDCGVNRQIIELLSIRPPPVEVKMKLLKEIAEEHEIDWDPSATETEYLKPHEDLLNGPTYFSGSTLPLPKEKHEEAVATIAAVQPNEDYESDGGFDELDLPEVPKAVIHPVSDTPSTPDIGPHVQSSQSAAHESSNPPDLEENPTADASFYNDMKSSEPPVSAPFAQPSMPAFPNEKKQFVPFASPPPFASAASMERNDSIPLNSPTPPLKPTEPEFFRGTIDEVTPPKTSNDFDMFSKHSERVHSTSPVERRENFDLDDVLSAAQSAADSAERAASAARAAANLAQLRIADLKKNSRVYENYGDGSLNESHNQTEVTQKPTFDHQDSFSSDTQSYGPSHVPQRSPSLEDDPYFSYPNLFSSKP